MVRLEARGEVPEETRLQSLAFGLLLTEAAGDIHRIRLIADAWLRANSEK